MTHKDLIRLILLWGALAGSAQALPLTASERAQTFATCAGRFAAEETYWGRTAPGDRDSVTFDALVEAVLPEAIAVGMPRAVASNAKFHAWRTHAYLHNNARFSPDAGRKARAQNRLAREIADCTALIR